MQRAVRGRRRPTVFLHVGAPKTGTTFLQEVLWRNRRALARDGVLYPGTHPAEHFHAALDVRGARFHGYDDPAVPGTWERVAAPVRRWRGRGAVISHETLAWAGEQHARRAVESLQPAEVHVVYTARDLVRQIPAVWQESVKNGRRVGFTRYLESLRAPEQSGPWGKGFWIAQDAVDVLRRWGSAVPAERIHVVTVPQPGAPPGTLWERFAGLVGVDPARYDTDVGGSNVSLGAVEVELLRRVNRAVGDDVDWPTYEALFKRGLAETTLGGRANACRITLPPRWHPWAVEQSERLVKGLREGGYDVVGDLDELLPQPLDDAEASSEGWAPPSPEKVLDAAAEAIVQLVLESRPGAGGRAEGWRRRVRELSDQYPALRRARAGCSRTIQHAQRIRSRRSSRHGS